VRKVQWKDVQQEDGDDDRDNGDISEVVQLGQVMYDSNDC